MKLSRIHRETVPIKKHSVFVHDTIRIMDVTLCFFIDGKSFATFKLAYGEIERSEDNKDERTWKEIFMRRRHMDRSVCFVDSTDTDG